MRISKQFMSKLIVFLFAIVLILCNVQVTYAAETETEGELACTFSHEVLAVGPDSTLSNGLFTVFPGDEVQYLISFLCEEDLYGLRIVNDFGLSIATLDAIQVYDRTGTQIPFATYAVQVSEDKREMVLDLSMLPEEADSVSLLYSNTVDSQVAVGEKGMYSMAYQVLSDGSEIVAQMVPRIYSFDLQLHVVDTSLPLEDDVALKNGMNVYSGQGLSEVGLELFYDESCEVPVTFLQQFRTYTFCANGHEDAINLLTTDSSGRLHLKGLGAGKYYLKVYPVSSVKETSLEIIPVTVGFENENGYATIPVGEVSVNTISDDTVITTMKAEVIQDDHWNDIVVDMSEEQGMSGVTATICLIGGCVVFLALVTAILVIPVVLRKRAKEDFNE